MSGGIDRKRRIHLFCPSVSKVSQLVAYDHQRIDLGAIARTFGVEPSSVKLNGHFISRGPEFISYSLTWNSLLSFLSARGLSIGATQSNPLIVDAKPLKLGAQYVDTGNARENECKSDGFSRNPQLEDSNLGKRKRCRDIGSEDGTDKITKSTNFSLKRKQLVGDFGPPKRIKMEETNLGSERREYGLPGTISNTLFPCSFVGQNTKRAREDEMVFTTACKKSR